MPEVLIFIISFEYDLKSYPCYRNANYRKYYPNRTRAHPKQGSNQTCQLLADCGNRFP